MTKKAFSLFIVVFLLFALITNSNAEIEIHNSSLYDRLKGKIILKVETNGEAYYISPAKQKMYFLSRPSDALKIMREQGIGISNSDLEKITVAGNSCSDILSQCKESNDAFVNKQKGKIFLQVEENGEAWYVNPNDSRRYFMGRPIDALNLMSNLGLGISNKDFEKLKEETLIKIKEDGRFAYYDGTITVSGYYRMFQPNTLLGGELCFFADEATGYLIPRDPNLFGIGNGDNRNPWFCFENQSESKKQFEIDESNIFNKTSTDCIKGDATVKITNYVVDKAEASVYDKARLIEILTSEDYQDCN